ncbi:hypothetical protein DJ021_14255 [Phenylobacterium hankyongense]|uniref:UrcA family protein n=1 Tax=Phenylobacterium hankyongense TaxID=1813876 RepID=A0A328B382_9CAUL|nr:hypothetical protein DJ021_14255 [Phenylobacterium hankyongense]
MRPWTLIAPLACATLTASCASPAPSSSAAPRIELPTEAARPCSLYVLPETPTRSALEIGYATRGAQLVACDAARNLAVQTHEAEHALEDRLASPARRRFFGLLPPANGAR